MAVLWEIAATETIVSAEKLINRFADQQITRLITEAVTDPSLQDIPPQIAKRMAEDCISQLYHVWSERRQKELQQKIKELEAQGSDEQLAALLKEHQQMLTNKDGNPYRLGKGGDFNG
jgi:hypothetical protein